MEDISKRVRSYWRQRYTLAIIDLVVLIIFLALIQFGGLSSSLEGACLGLVRNFYLALGVYFITLTLLYNLICLPLTFYGGYLLERKFNLTNLSVRGWAKEEVKKLLVSAVIFVLLVESFFAIGRNFASIWWLYAAGFWIFFSVVLARIFPVLIMPIFYKLTPLSDEKLRKRILELAGRFRIAILDTFVIDFSKTTKKSNAAVVGWGKTRRVVLADNLVNEFSADEIEVVLAHEMAHYKLGHIWKLLLFGAVSNIVFFYMLSSGAGVLSTALGLSALFDIRGLPALLALFVLYGTVIGPLGNAFSRRLETDADLTALKVTHLKDAFISLMKKLAHKNLSDESPNLLLEIIFYDHPPISKRVRMAENFSDKG